MFFSQTPAVAPLIRPGHLTFFNHRLGDAKIIHILKDEIFFNPKKYSNLNSLKLGGNNITGVAIDAIINYLILNKEIPLKKLGLNGNQLTDADVDKLILAIQGRQDSPLVELDLRANSLLSAEKRKIYSFNPQPLIVNPPEVGLGIVNNNF